MQHLDPESLSLLALGEELGDDAAAHLRSCPSCAADYEGLRRAVVAAKPGPAATALESPGPQVWAGIHSALGLSSAVAADPLESPTSSGSGQSSPPRANVAARHRDGASVPGGRVRPEAGPQRRFRLAAPSRGVAGGRRGRSAAGGRGLLVRAAEPAGGDPAGPGRTCAGRPAFRHGLGPGRRSRRTGSARWRSGWTRTKPGATRRSG